MVSRTPDPPLTGHFTLTVDGVEIGAFTEVRGLSVTLETEDLVEGGQNQFVHKLPRGLKWQNLVLKRGLTNSDGLFTWITECSGDGFSGAGHVIRPKTATIRVLDTAGRPVRTWSVEGAFPVKWTGPAFAATSRELAVEELEVCHRGFVAS